jgi:hypothetical protein
MLKPAFNKFILNKYYYTKTLIKINKKEFFITNAIRSSKNVDNMLSPKGLTDEITYYKQMKEFIKETQGVPRNSQKWFDLRNKHYRILYEKSREYIKNNFKETTDTQYLRFYVLIVPESNQCYELVSILNFFQLRYKALEDSPVSKSIMRQMLGIFSKDNYKNFSYPFMIFESSEEPRQNIDGFENIMKFLIENNFIHDYRSNTVYEKDGLKFIEGFKKYFENEFKKFSNKFSFYFRVTNFKEARYWYHPHKDGYIYRNRIFSRLYRLGKDILYDIFSNFKYSMTLSWNSNPKKSKKDLDKENSKILLELVKIWVERMNKNPFHGGDIPDAADFRLYSLIRKYTACRKINLKFKKYVKMEASGLNIQTDDKTDNQYKNVFTHFDDWVSRMYILCNRSSFYNLREVGYNYNKYLSDDIIEQEKINKPLHETQQESMKKTQDSEVGDENSINTGGVKMNKNNIMGVFGNRIKRNKINF